MKRPAGHERGDEEEDDEKEEDAAEGEASQQAHGVHGVQTGALLMMPAVWKTARRAPQKAHNTDML